VVLAAVASAALVGGGASLHRARGRTEAAVAMVGAGTAGMFATLLVAADVYHLIAWPLALAGSMITGAVATALAIRWAGRAIGAIGLLGALLSPALVGVLGEGSSIAVLAVATACALAVILWQDWIWLALATPLISAPQWTIWMLAGHTLAANLAVLVVFSMLGLAGAVGAQLRSADDRLRPSAAVLLVLNAAIAGVIGELTLRHFAGATAAELWLVGLGAVHVAAAVHKRLAAYTQARALLIAIGAILADVAFGLAAGGLTLTLGWGATSIGCALLARRATRDSAGEALLGLGVGAHVGLVLLRALLAVPPTHLGGGQDLTQLLTVATLAACCVGCGLLAGKRRPFATALYALGLAATAYLTAAELAGDALVAAWAVQAAALAQLYRRTHDQLASVGALSFLAGAALHALAVEAPPSALLTGAPNLHAATIALAFVAAVLIQIGRGDLKPIAWTAAAITVLYLTSVALVTVFQPGAGTAPLTVLDLSVRQQGQVLLSAMWSVLGLAALVTGLRRKLDLVRTAGLALLMLSVVKVFVYDLSTLTSIYRVISFIVLGLLLLAGAFAYQRMRPSPSGP
jgi:uncharacterized membrane protein